MEKPSTAFALVCLLNNDNDADGGDLVREIENLRNEHDKASKKWPPHISILWPFVSRRRRQDMSQQVEEALGEFKAFALSFDGLAVLSQSDDGDDASKKSNKGAAAAAGGSRIRGASDKVYVVLEPTLSCRQQLCNLHKTFFSLFPECVETSGKSTETTAATIPRYHPHLTIGQMPLREAEGLVASFNRRFKDEEWGRQSIKINCLDVLERPGEDKPFKSMSKYFLLQDEE